MRKWFTILLFFFSAVGWAQEQFTGTIRVRKPQDVTPKIAGKAGGVITPEEFCISDGIYVTAKGVKVTSFEIAYGDNESFVEGHQMTPAICSAVAKIQTGQKISIYNIRAKDSLGREVTLTPMLFEIANNFNEVTQPKEVISVEKTWGLAHLGKFFGTNETMGDGLTRIYLVFNSDYTVWYFHHKTHPNAVKAMIDFEKADGKKNHGTFEITDNKYIKVNLDDSLFKFDLDGEILKTGIKFTITTLTEDEGNSFFVIPLGDRLIWD
ncbi:MAG: hypothetical protein ACOZCO_12305 [Bacteroidota bacterium]